MSTQDGGPAFPHSFEGAEYASINGMSLRDYFAGQSIMGFLPGTMIDQGSIDGLARQAYILADAMLEAREAK